MINCKHCGHRIFDTDRKCVECGAPAVVPDRDKAAGRTDEIFGGTAIYTPVNLRLGPPYIGRKLPQTRWKRETRETYFLP